MAHSPPGSIPTSGRPRPTPTELPPPYNFQPLPGAFTASADVRTDVTDSSLVEFFKELRRIRDTPVDGDYVHRIMAVAAEDVRRVARQYIRTDSVVVVGDVERIRPGIERLGLGLMVQRKP